jgi:threonine dehydrogenase-like Zn-dependent dehydrogenase
MKALRVDKTGLAVQDVPPPIANGEAVVRVIRSGICNTDLEIAQGYAGFTGTIGHEFVGVVESSAKDGDLVGKRVVGEINVGCGVCELCRAGDPRHCGRRTVLGIHGRDGAHAEFLRLPDENLFPVPDTISDNEAVFVEPLAAACGISEQIELVPGTRVAVIGDGKLGILIARCIAPLVGGVTMIGKHKEKLEIASRDTRIETVLLADGKQVGRSFDVVVEASGSESGFGTALDLLRPRGKLVLKSTFYAPSRWETSRVVVNEITVLGSRCGRFGPALALLEGGNVNVADLISVEFPLAQGTKAMEKAAAKGILKVILTM